MDRDRMRKRMRNFDDRREIGNGNEKETPERRKSQGQEVEGETTES